MIEIFDMDIENRAKICFPDRTKRRERREWQQDEKNAVIHFMGINGLPLSFDRRLQKVRTLP